MASTAPSHLQVSLVVGVDSQIVDVLDDAVDDGGIRNRAVAHSQGHGMDRQKMAQAGQTPHLTQQVLKINTHSG